MQLLRKKRMNEDSASDLLPEGEDARRADEGKKTPDYEQGVVIYNPHPSAEAATFSQREKIRLHACLQLQTHTDELRRKQRM